VAVDDRAPLERHREGRRSRCVLRPIAFRALWAHAGRCRTPTIGSRSARERVEPAASRPAGSCRDGHHLILWRLVSRPPETGPRGTAQTLMMEDLAEDSVEANDVRRPSPRSCATPLPTRSMPIWSRPKRSADGVRPRRSVRSAKRGRQRKASAVVDVHSVATSHDQARVASARRHVDALWGDEVVGSMPTSGGAGGPSPRARRAGRSLAWLTLLWTHPEAASSRSGGVPVVAPRHPLL
jgi:hypothetical protein